MELRRYLRIIGERWWVVLLAFAVTTAVTVALVLPQPFVYVSMGTTLLRPRSLGAEAQVDASDLLIRGVKIAATYATIAQSDLIRAGAEEVMESTEDLDDYTVTAEVLIDTNILSIGVRGPDPELARDLAAAISTETVRYVDELADAYVLEPLDEPVVPGSPVAPNKKLTLMLGGLLGLLLGIGLAFFARYLSAPAAVASASDVLDVQTAVYNERFLRQRLREETSRAERSGGTLSFGWLSVRLRRGEDDELALVPGKRDLRRLAQAMQLTLREEAVLAHIGEGAFGVLLPDMPKQEADGLLTGWHAAVSTLLDGNGTRVDSEVQITTAACQLGPRGFVGDREAKQVVRRLLEAPTPAARAHRATSVAVVPDPPVNGGDPEGEGRDSADLGGSPGEGEVVEVAAPPSQDWRGPNRRRRAWKGKTRAGDRAG